MTMMLLAIWVLSMRCLLVSSFKLIICCGNVDKSLFQQVDPMLSVVFTQSLPEVVQRAQIKVAFFEVCQLMTLLPHVRFSNLYGPTETNVCTYYHVTQIPDNTDETIPIGVACANIEDIVVEVDDKVVETGEIGELLIRGGVVMKGYWGQPDRNQKCFYRRPAFGQFEDIFYRTGDLVKEDTNGNYLYMGRKDRQIKTRGYRVELDEVEVVLLSHPGVEEAAVYTIPDGQGSNLIEAAVISKLGTNLTEAQLLDHSGKKLPPYALPVRVTFYQEFPRTSTGKINRLELQGGRDGL
jgi:acyl-coenzyme A synthetase/AMP-(fatty) acid ligase